MLTMNHDSDMLMEKTNYFNLINILHKKYSVGRKIELLNKFLLKLQT